MESQRDRRRKEPEAAMDIGVIPVRALLPEVVERPCDECSAVARSFAFLKPEDVLCARCAEAEGDKRERWEKAVDAEHYVQRLTYTGLRGETRIVEALGLAKDNPEPELAPGKKKHLRAVSAATDYFGAAKRGLLIIAGPSGTGKSTAAGWLAWRTHGRFLPRTDWSGIETRGRDKSRLAWVKGHAGAVVLDDAFVVRPGDRAGDSDWEQEAVFQIAVHRHEAGLATVITTNATLEDFRHVYGTRGEALLRRARDGEDLAGKPEGGGFVQC